MYFFSKIRSEIFDNVAKLFPFFYHHVTSVRRASLDTTAVVLPQIVTSQLVRAFLSEGVFKDFMFMCTISLYLLFEVSDSRTLQILQYALRHIFQRSLVEENEDVIKTVEKVYTISIILRLMFIMYIHVLHE